MNALRALLNPTYLTDVVDIGANPIDGGDLSYQAMLQAGLCRVTGFEPQEEALVRLNANKGNNERYLPYAVGDGREGLLRICRASGMSSLLEPDPATLALFVVLQPLGEVVQRVPLMTRRLDDIEEIERVDFLKMDVQGSELAVFQSGRNKLAGSVVIQVEVSFLTLYQNQPAFGEIDLELRHQGFVPHCFADVKKWPIAPCVVNNDPRLALNQLLEADMVYVRDFSRSDSMSDEQLKQLILVAHHCYRSFDLALHCLSLLETRNCLGVGSQQKYIEMLKSEERTRQ